MTPGSKLSPTKWENKPRYSSPSQGQGQCNLGLREVKLGLDIHLPLPPDPEVLLTRDAPSSAHLPWAGRKQLVSCVPSPHFPTLWLFLTRSRTLTALSLGRGGPPFLPFPWNPRPWQWYGVQRSAFHS